MASLPAPQRSQNASVSTRVFRPGAGTLPALRASLCCPGNAYAEATRSIARRGRRRDRRERRHAEALGPHGQAAHASRRAQPSTGLPRRGSAPRRAPAAPPHRDAEFGAQPLSRRRALGRGRRGDGARRDRGRPLPADGGDHTRLRPGARARSRRPCERAREGDVGDGGERRRVRRAASRCVCAPALAALAGWLLVGCGGGSSSLEVSAAASLKKAFTSYGTQLSTSKTSFSFAGSDALAAQIEQGAHPDVFASANTKLPAMLYAKGLVERPVVFAANKLVLAVPASSSITSLAGIERAGVSIALGTPSVPVGAYSEKVIAQLAPVARRALLVNVGKLVEGASGAGFLYVTDVTATAGQLRAIDLPASLQPRVAYAAAVVRGSGHGAEARAFISGLLSGPGRADLLSAGFLAPPAQ